MLGKRKKINRTKFNLSNKYIFLILSFICIVSLFIGMNFNIKGGPLSDLADYCFVPMQKGLNSIGLFASNRMDELKNIRQLMIENEELQKKVDELTSENSTLKLEQYELESLRELYELDKKYPSYKKTAARVIAKDSGNWFDTFVINKGSADGIKVDMNVIAGSGLVGIVTSVRKHSATVTTIINDMSNVSGMMISTSDYCIVRGSIKSMNEKQGIIFDTLNDLNDMITEGEQVVTSNISDKYLEGILIGYVTEIKIDSNNLTKSGTITPVVDFAHLEEVLVILQTKKYD
ncbi:MAG: rod shape-determining protein MreC [Lachnospiraceae bacterium]|nr:rod shape-determining protein MreC [Lachnospiraceae bacterium]MBR5788868.1 rod shape-determining protein MreC [Lachnospiraceae bacterium]